VIGSRIAIRIPQVNLNITVDDTFVFIALLLYGGEAAVIIGALAGVCDPEKKRHIIGQQFVEVQERVLQEGRFLEGNWILGQGTIYPDTIESGGTAKADLIKTHHNRVAGIQRLIDTGRIIGCILCKPQRERSQPLLGETLGTAARRVLDRRGKIDFRGLQRRNQAEK